MNTTTNTINCPFDVLDGTPYSVLNEAIRLRKTLTDSEQIGAFDRLIKEELEILLRKVSVADSKH